MDPKSLIPIEKDILNCKKLPGFHQWLDFDLFVSRKDYSNMNVSCVGLLFLEEIVDPCLNVLPKGARGQPLGSVRVVFPLCSTRFMAIITYKPGRKRKSRSEHKILISDIGQSKEGVNLLFPNTVMVEYADLMEFSKAVLAGNEWLPLQVVVL